MFLFFQIMTKRFGSTRSKPEGSAYDIVSAVARTNYGNTARRLNRAYPDAEWIGMDTITFYLLVNTLNMFIIFDIIIYLFLRQFFFFGQRSVTLSLTGDAEN